MKIRKKQTVFYHFSSKRISGLTFIMTKCLISQKYKLLDDQSLELKLNNQSLMVTYYILYVLEIHRQNMYLESCRRTGYWENGTEELRPSSYKTIVRTKHFAAITFIRYVRDPNFETPTIKT